MYCCAYISALSLVSTSVLSLVLPGIDAKNKTDRIFGTSRRHHAVCANQRRDDGAAQPSCIKVQAVDF